MGEEGQEYGTGAQRLYAREKIIMFGFLHLVRYSRCAPVPYCCRPKSQTVLLRTYDLGRVTKLLQTSYSTSIEVSRQGPAELVKKTHF